MLIRTLTFKTWLLYRLRQIGLYKGPIQFVVKAKAGQYFANGR